MSVRIKRYNTNTDAPGDDNATEYLDTDINQMTGIDSEGYQYHFGVNEVRNFADDGRGLAIPSSNGSVNLVADAIPFGGAQS